MVEIPSNTVHLAADFEVTLASSRELIHSSFRYAATILANAHHRSLAESSIRAASASTGTGKMGGRGTGRRHPYRNSAADPQMRPWQGPMPHRVCSFASRHESQVRISPWVTSSQRHTIVASN